MAETETATVGGTLLLGVIQGLTEFLPVSSSGHLVLAQQFIEVGEESILFNLVLHMGTLVPVLWFYREWVLKLLLDPFLGDGPLLERPGVRWLGLLVAASVPTAIIGLAFEDLFDALFSTPATLVVSFSLTGIILWASGRFDRSERSVQLSLPLALALGVAQGLAITPGISRSGTTIAVALMLGVDREQAARFSFLMSVPAISGGLLLKLRHAQIESLDIPQLAIGGGAAMITGYAALVWRGRLVRAGKLSAFSGYAFAVAAVAGVIAWMGS